MEKFWRLRRYWRRHHPPMGAAGPRRGRPRPGVRGCPLRPWQITLGVGLLVAALITGFLEARLRPMVVTAAQSQAQNAISAVLEEVILTQLGEDGISYFDLVTIQRDGSGVIAAVTADTGAMNRLRARLVEAVLEALRGVDVSQIQIPLGSLLDFDLIWGLGPTLKVHAMTVGTVEGEFSSTFTSGGVNQTVHRIALELTVPLTLMLPGGAVETVCQSSIPIAETVIVGQVPQVFLQNAGS